MPPMVGMYGVYMPPYVGYSRFTVGLASLPTPVSLLAESQPPIFHPFHCWAERASSLLSRFTVGLEEPVLTPFRFTVGLGMGLFPSRFTVGLCLSSTRFTVGG